MIETTELNTVPAQNGCLGRGDAATHEISIVELTTVLLRRKKWIGVAGCAMALVTGLIAWLLPASFSAEAAILPPQQQQSSLSAMAGSLGGLAGMSMASQLGLKSPGDLYIGILGSRTISDEIINEFHLQRVYKTELQSETRAALAKHATFSNGKDSLIKINVSDGDPNRAAAIANAYVDELYKQNSRIAITDASQRRLFFEQQITGEKELLSKAETALKDLELKTGLVAPAGQAEVLLRSGAQLRAEIVSRQVQLEGLRQYATEANPQVQTLRKEISALEGQRATLENKGQEGGSIEISAGKFPGATLDHIRKMRDVRYHESLFELLSKQYEAARIDEAKEGPAIQVVDRAVPPDHKSWPPRALFVLGGLVVGTVGAACWILLQEATKSMAADPNYASQLQSLASALRA